MRTNVQLRWKDNGNEHRKLIRVSEEGQLALFMIVGQAALLTLLTSPSFLVAVATVLYVETPCRISLRGREDALLSGNPH